MIDPLTLEKLATQFQTTPLNVAREYCQHLMLSMLYQQQAATRVLFKGGTALRIIYGSPGFSEDLDFSGFGIRAREIEELLVATLSAVERVGLNLDIKEAKTTSGGYLGIIHSRFLSYHIEIQIEVSLRPRRAVSPATALIAGDLLPAYTLLHLPQEMLVEEKLQALLDRRKPRDFYDLYFMLRKGLLTPAHRKMLSGVMDQLRPMKTETFSGLRLFLPKDQQGLIKNFRTTLERELRRHVA